MTLTMVAERHPPHDPDEIVLVTLCAEWQIATSEDDRQSGLFNPALLRNVSTRLSWRCFLAGLSFRRLQKRRNGSEEIEMNAPIRVVRAQISKILVDEMGRIGNNQVPLLRLRYIPKISEQ